MNNPSPLIPQGSFLEQKNKGRARVRIAVFVVLAIHGIGLLALLMQGCKKEPEPIVPSEEVAQTNALPTFEEPTNALPLGTSGVAELPVSPPSASESITQTTPPPVTPSLIMPAATVTEYKVLPGDTYTSIAKKFNVTIRAVSDANPGVDARRLQVGQLLKIPPPSAPANEPGTPVPPTDNGGAQTYTVKSGDTLTSIAKQHGVTIKALRAANSLSTDRIVVGQKLKIPAKALPPSGGTSSPTGGGATVPVGQ